VQLFFETKNRVFPEYWWEENTVKKGGKTIVNVEEILDFNVL